MILDYWERRLQRWMNAFSDDEPDLIGQELVREFDRLTKKFYGMFDDDLMEWSESSEICIGIKSEVVKKEVYATFDGPYPDNRQNDNHTKAKKSKRKFESAKESSVARVDNSIESRIDRVEQDSLEDVIVSGKNIKVVLQLPGNNRKEDIKVVTQDDNSVSISFLNCGGKRYTRTLKIPYYIDFEAAKATYRNGILEIAFNRK
jgi:HSP20 family molecular chaperone IbpA